MNERIRKLAEQTGADFMRRINYNNLEGKEYEEDAGVIFESNESFEKFAELIVEECRYVMDCNKGSDQNSVWNQALSETSEKIKEHFGVEQ